MESKPKVSDQERGGVAFYVQEVIKHEVIEFQCEMECLTIQRNFHTKTIGKFCVVYRPHSLKTPSFCKNSKSCSSFYSD